MGLNLALKGLQVKSYRTAQVNHVIHLKDEGAQASARRKEQP